MKKNMGDIDINIRKVLGIVAIFLAIFVTTGVWDIVLYVIGGIMIITALVGVCPLYIPFGISTRKK